MVIAILDKIKKENKDTGKLEHSLLYMDGFLKADLDFIKERVLQHNDFFLCVIDGRVGCGKSTFTIGLVCYLNQETKLHNICFTLEEFEKRLRAAESGEVIVLDESFELNKRSSQSSSNFRILSLLQQMREKKLFIFLILPSIYDLDKTVILNLCDYFIHVWREPFGRRGQFSAYDRRGFIDLWLYSRLTYSYPRKVARPIFKGRFTKNFPLDYAEYRRRKLSALETFKSKEENKELGKSLFKPWRNNQIYDFYKKGKSVEEL